MSRPRAWEPSRVYILKKEIQRKGTLHWATDRRTELSGPLIPQLVTATEAQQRKIPLGLGKMWPKSKTVIFPFKRFLAQPKAASGQVDLGPVTGWPVADSQYIEDSQIGRNHFNIKARVDTNLQQERPYYQSHQRLNTEPSSMRRKKSPAPKEKRTWRRF